MLDIRLLAHPQKPNYRSVSRTCGGVHLRRFRPLQQPFLQASNEIAAAAVHAKTAVPEDSPVQADTATVAEISHEARHRSAGFGKFMGSGIVISGSPKSPRKSASLVMLLFAESRRFDFSIVSILARSAGETEVACARSNVFSWACPAIADSATTATDMKWTVFKAFS